MLTPTEIQRFLELLKTKPIASQKVYGFSLSFNKEDQTYTYKATDHRELKNNFNKIFKKEELIKFIQEKPHTHELIRSSIEKSV